MIYSGRTTSQETPKKATKTKETELSRNNLRKLQHLLRNAVLLHQVVGLRPPVPELGAANVALVVALITRVDLFEVSPGVVEV